MYTQIKIDPANVEAGIKEALLKARESEAIAKYLGTSEAKIRAGFINFVMFLNNGTNPSFPLCGVAILGHPDQSPVFEYTRTRKVALARASTRTDT